MTRECPMDVAWRRLPGGAELRLLRPNEAEELHALIESNRDRLAFWLPWAAGQAFEDTVEFLDRAGRRCESNDGFQAAIVRDGRIVGVVGYTGVDWTNRSTAIGYWLAAGEEGRGTMTEAVRVLAEHGLSAWRLNRVEIRVAVDNSRSLAIPQRLGFGYEATLRKAQRISDRHVDLAVYSLLTPNASSMKGPSSSPA
jgi:ribosomal-protein-serine acetyltransferase